MGWWGYYSADNDYTFDRVARIKDIIKKEFLPVKKINPRLLEHIYSCQQKRGGSAKPPRIDALEFEALKQFLSSRPNINVPESVKECAIESLEEEKEDILEGMSSWSDPRERVKAINLEIEEIKIFTEQPETNKFISKINKIIFDNWDYDVGVLLYFFHTEQKFTNPNPCFGGVYSLDESLINENNIYELLKDL